MSSRFAVVPCLLALLLPATASAQFVGGGGNTTFSESTSGRIEFAPETVVQTTTSAAATGLLGRLEGGATVFDQTFDAAFSDPAVQAGVAAARSALLAAGGPRTSILAPTLVDTRTSTTSTSSTRYSIAGLTDPIPAELLQPYGTLTDGLEEFMAARGLTVTDTGTVRSYPGIASTFGFEVTVGPGVVQTGDRGNCVSAIASLPSSSAPVCAPADPLPGTVPFGATNTNTNIDTTYTVDVTTTVETRTTVEEDYELLGRVWEVAQGQVSPQTVDFGVVRVGDAAAPQALTITNVAPVAAYNDTLAAAFEGLPAGPFGGEGSVQGLGAGESDTTSMRVTLDTTSAGNFALTGPFVRFTSQNPELPDLDLGTADLQLLANVQVQGQVNDLAAPAYALTGGPASLTGGPATFTLDLGTLAPDAGLVTLALALQNVAAGGPQDDLSGSFALTDLAGVFGFAGIDPFADLAPGEALPLTLTFDPTAAGPGRYTGVLQLLGFSTFPGLDPLALTGAGRLEIEAVVTPLPVAAWFFLSGLAGLVLLRRRRAAA